MDLLHRQLLLGRLLKEKVVIVSVNKFLLSHYGDGPGDGCGNGKGCGERFSISGLGGSSSRDGSGDGNAYDEGGVDG